MRRMTLTTAVALAVLIGAGLSPAMAHHGWSSYRSDVEMELTVTELRLGNPHDRLVAADAEGGEWNLLLAPPARNRRFGFNEDTLAVGDRIELYGQKHPSRQEIKVHCIFVGDEAVYTYRYGNGRSSLERTGRDKRC